MLVPLAGRMLQSHVPSALGTVMEMTTGAIQNASDDARDDTVVLHLAERNSVLLTVGSTESSPAMAKRNWSPPMFMSARVTMEYIICTDVRVHSQPNRLSAARMCAAAQSTNAAPLMKRAADSLATPSETLQIGRAHV